jgi:hypothetical protein
MLVRRKKQEERPGKAERLLPFSVAAKRTGIPLSTLKENAEKYGFTVVNLNKGLPVPALKKNYLRLKESEVEAAIARSIAAAEADAEKITDIAAFAVRRAG